MAVLIVHHGMGFCPLLTASGHSLSPFSSGISLIKGDSHGKGDVQGIHRSFLRDANAGPKLVVFLPQPAGFLPEDECIGGLELDFR